MKEEVKEMWITALESGEFTQGTGCLRRGDSYCCLGVLCELAVRTGVIEPGVADPAFDGKFSYSNPIKDYVLLPPSVQDWAGLTHNPAFSDKSLAEMNDMGMTFREIAQLIRTGDPS